MSDNTAAATEPARRETAARQAIKNGFDMEDEDSGVAMFVAFHLEELDAGYWQPRLGTARFDEAFAVLLGEGRVCLRLGDESADHASVGSLADQADPRTQE